MAKSLDATYDPSKKWKPIEEGMYPAHVKSLSSKEINTRAGEAIVVNMTYKVAEDVSRETQPVWKMDGYEYVKILQVIKSLLQTEMVNKSIQLVNT